MAPSVDLPWTPWTRTRALAAASSSLVTWATTWPWLPAVLAAGARAWARDHQTLHCTLSDALTVSLLSPCTVETCWSDHWAQDGQPLSVLHVLQMGCHGGAAADLCVSSGHNRAIFACSCTLPVYPSCPRAPH